MQVAVRRAGRTGANTIPAVMRSTSSFNNDFVPGASNGRRERPRRALSRCQMRRHRDTRARPVTSPIRGAVPVSACVRIRRSGPGCRAVVNSARRQRIGAGLITAYRRSAQTARTRCWRAPPCRARGRDRDRRPRAWRAAPRHRDAWRAGAARPALRISLRQSRPRPKAAGWCRACSASFDSLNPFIVKGLPPQGMRAPLVSGSNIIAGLRGREPDGARLRRAVHALWAARADRSRPTRRALS